jgi:hypothetical protein
MLATRSETTLKVRLKPVPAGEQSIRMAHNLPVELIVTQYDRRGRWLELNSAAVCDIKDHVI